MPESINNEPAINVHQHTAPVTFLFGVYIDAAKEEGAGGAGGGWSALKRSSEQQQQQQQQQQWKEMSEEAGWMSWDVQWARCSA